MARQVIEQGVHNYTDATDYVAPMNLGLYRMKQAHGHNLKSTGPIFLLLKSSIEMLIKLLIQLNSVLTDGLN